MEPQTQHIWFWIAAACIVGSVMSLRTDSFIVVENAVETAPKKYDGVVYRSRVDLPDFEADHALAPLILPPSQEVLTHSAANPLEESPLLLPQRDNAQSDLKTTDTSPIVTTNFQEPSGSEQEPLLPESVWLSGGIELNE